MHIVHVIDGLGLGGAERMLVDVANASSRDGHRVSVCVTRDNLLQRRALAKEIHVFALNRKGRFSLSPALHFARWIRSANVDVLHVHMRGSLSFILALRSLGLVRAPIVFHDHYGTIEIDTAVPIWFRIGQRLVDQYVGVYERLTEWALSAGVSRERAMTIPNALDLTRLLDVQPADLRTVFAIPAEQLAGILVATIRRDKGIETLVDAVLRSRHRDRMRILIAGGEPDPQYAEECRALVKQHRLEDAITFLGPRSDVPSLLHGADFAVLSSHTESGPLVLIEYLAASLPVVSTAVGNIGLKLRDQGLPGFVPPREASQLASALDALLELEPAARRARGELGRKLLAASWDIREAMPAWYLAYSRAIARRRSRER